MIDRLTVRIRLNQKIGFPMEAEDMVIATKKT
jgi:hypothetical protein